MELNSLVDIIDKNGSGAMETSQNEMEFVNSWWLMSSPMSPAIILATYLMFVLKIGPDYMRERKPYKLQSIIAVYNVIQVFLSIFLVYACGRMLAMYGVIPKTCVMDTDYSRYGIASGMHYYLMAKVSELLDTVFFVLRKKDRQLSFLHIYHHTLMIIVTWTALKYEPTIHLLFLGVVNSFIHVIMYAYYGLSSFPAMSKYLWWKKYITSLQLVQFVMVMIQFAIAAATSECSPSIVLFTALSFNGFLFLYLFGKFYINNYRKKSKAAAVKIDNGKCSSMETVQNGINGNGISSTGISGIQNTNKCIVDDFTSKTINPNTLNRIKTVKRA
ncbi:very long chain fatty acid elongase 7-like [Anticarsia gemmatalis]|uniref:very long chain fatty acid elongase 7-like n=1 Tax=Anticarsia gemmatalis TaxID=129554 RepID=UPI003F75F21C